MQFTGKRNPIFIFLIRTLVLLAAASILIGGSIVTAFAEIASEDSLQDSTWTYLFEDDLTDNGVIQSICATHDYLITIENTSGDSSKPDTVSAYYKNKVDANGNPVKQYSLAMRNSDFDWEHGNGMTYNSNTREIYVALYSNASGDNEGCLYVMDPDTLAFKRKIKIAEGYNILGIDYDSKNDQYYTLTNAAANYTLERRDANFNLIETIGPIDPAPGTNFQDICVSGDYIFLSPLTFGMGIGDFMNIYSISRRETLLSVDMNMELEAKHVEAEGVCMAHKGVFVCPITVTWEDDTRHVYFFQTTLPWFYTIETSARGMTYDREYTVYTVDDGSGEIPVYSMGGEPGDSQTAIGGKVSTGTQQALSGTSFTVTFEPDPGYKVASAYLDVTPLTIEEGQNSITIDNIDGNHRITVDFIPESKPTPVPTASPAASRTDPTGDGSGKDSASDQPSSSQISTPGTAASGTNAASSSKSATSKRIFGVIALFVFTLLSALAIYIRHVHLVREVSLKERKHEREERIKHLQDTSETKSPRKRRRKKAAGHPNVPSEHANNVPHPGNADGRRRKKRKKKNITKSPS